MLGSELTQAQLIAAINNSREGIALLNEKFQPTYRSPSKEAITGWTDEERSKFSAVDKTHPEDLYRGVLKIEC